MNSTRCHTPDRRTFLAAAAAVGATALTGPLLAQDKRPEPFKISLAEWSLHRALKAGKLDNLDFAKTAKEDYGIDAIEFVNQFFKDKARDLKYLGELKQRSERMHPFASLEEIDAALAGLAERELVVQLDRRPGQKEARYAQLLGESGDVPAAPLVTDVEGDRVAALESRVRELEETLAALQARLGEPSSLA